jgi:hypothetical protein
VSYNGSRMMGVHAQGDSPGFRIQVPYCPSNGTGSIAGLQLTFQFWAVADSGYTTPSNAIMYVYTDAAWAAGGPATNINFGSLVNLVEGVQIDSAGSQGTYFGVVVSLSNDWSGWFYFDSFDLR